MTDVREVTCRPLQTRPLWIFVGIGAAGAILAVARVAYRGELLDVWLGLGLFFALLGIAFLYAVTVRVSADAFGLHSRTLLRRRSVPWHDLADLRVYVQYGEERGRRSVASACCCATDASGACPCR